MMSLARQTWWYAPEASDNKQAMNLVKHRNLSSPFSRSSAQNILRREFFKYLRKSFCCDSENIYGKGAIPKSDFDLEIEVILLGYMLVMKYLWGATQTTKFRMGVVVRMFDIIMDLEKWGRNIVVLAQWHLSIFWYPMAEEKKRDVFCWTPTLDGL